jgi:hypothetical protein
VFQLGGPMITSSRAKLREMCAFSQASSVVAAPLTRQYPVASACADESRRMTGDPLGSAGCLASRTAPGGGTNVPRIAFASTAARCLAGPDGWLLTVTAVVPEEAAVCGAEVAVPQPAASSAPVRRKNEVGFPSFTPLRRRVPGGGSVLPGRARQRDAEPVGERQAGDLRAVRLARERAGRIARGDVAGG